MTGAAVASAAVGVGGLRAGKKAGDAAEASSAQAQAQAEQMNAELRKLGLEGVEFAQGMMDNWESTFGGIQDNLSEYYSGLDPTKFATQGKQNLAQEMDKSMKQFNDSMSAQGLQSSGMKAQNEKEAMFAQAQGNAAIDLGAPEVVNQMKQGFVNSGEGQRSTASNMMNSAMGRQGSYLQQGGSNVQDSYQNEADNYGKSQQGYMGMAGTGFGGAIGLGINAGGTKVPRGSSTQRALEGPMRPGGGF